MVYPCIRLLAGMALALTGGHVLAEEVFIALKARAVVESRNVSLGELAEVTARQPDLAQKLKAATLTLAAPLSQPASLTRDELEQQLRKKGLLPAGGVAWGGAGAVQVSGKLRRVDLSPGVSAAASSVMDQVGPGYRANLRLLDDGGQVEVPPGRLALRPEMQAVVRNGSVVEVPVTVDVDGTPAARPVVRFEVTRTALKGHGSAKSVARTPALAPSTGEKKESGQVPAATTATLAPSLPAGAPMPAEAPSVEKDRPVHILVQAGAVRLEGEGIALADGRKGDRVKVRRTGSEAEVLARVQGQGRVLVEEQE